MVAMDRKKQVMSVLCLIFGLWSFGTNWTTTLLSFLQWDTVEVMSIVDLSYIQAFGSFCNAFGALLIGQITDTAGPQSMFIFSTVLTSLYYVALGFANNWYLFMAMQILRVGYQLDATAEMYLATVTTERERTGALMVLTIPQALSMFLAPMVASKVAVWTSLRTSQIINGCVMPVLLLPVLWFLLPTTHSIPRLASARLRPLEYIAMIKKNAGLREGLLLRGLLVTSYVCYELIARNFLLRQFMKGTTDSAEVIITMGASLLFVQFFVLPFLQKRFSPKALLQLAVGGLVVSYTGVLLTSNLYHFLLVTALQTSCYAVAYAESCTQITSAVEQGELGKATGLASMTQWIVHFFVPIYTSHLVQHWHYEYAFYSSAAVMVFTFAFITVFAKNTNARLASVLPSMIVT